MKSKQLTGAMITAAALGAAMLAPTEASAHVPSGRSFSDLAAMFPNTTCVDAAGQVVGTDLIVNRGGGNVAWLPDGTHLVGTSFAMYDMSGNLLLIKQYGNDGRSRSNVTCTSTGADPDTGNPVSVVFNAVTSP